MLDAPKHPNTYSLLVPAPSHLCPPARLQPNAVHPGRLLRGREVQPLQDLRLLAIDRLQGAWADCVPRRAGRFPSTRQVRLHLTGQLRTNPGLSRPHSHAPPQDITALRARLYGVQSAFTILGSTSYNYGTCTLAPVLCAPPASLPHPCPPPTLLLLSANDPRVQSPVYLPRPELVLPTPLLKRAGQTRPWGPATTHHLPPPPLLTYTYTPLDRALVADMQRPRNALPKDGHAAGDRAQQRGGRRVQVRGTMSFLEGMIPIAYACPTDHAIALSPLSARSGGPQCLHARA